MKRNPKVKVGDKLTLLEKNNGGAAIQKGEIVTVVVARLYNYIQVENEDGIRSNLYYSGPADNFILTDKKTEIKHLEIDIKNLNKKISIKNTRIDFLNKYETEEDFLAESIENILTLPKASRISKIKDILNEIKKVKQ